MDFVTGIDDDGGEFQKWLCAEHYDMVMRLVKILNDRNEDRNFEFRPPRPGKEIE